MFRLYINSNGRLSGKIWQAHNSVFGLHSGLKEYTIKGFTLNDDRFKVGSSNELFQRIAKTVNSWDTICLKSSFYQK